VPGRVEVRRRVLASRQVPETHDYLKKVRSSKRGKENDEESTIKIQGLLAKVSKESRGE